MKIAGVQMGFQIGDVSGNVERMISKVRESRSQGAQLTVFPECAATGYCFTSLDEARPFAEPIDGPITQRMSRTCADLGGYIVFGLLEADGNRVFNALAMVGPKGLIASYRKIHLPFLGVDMFTNFGDRPFSVCDVEGVRIGLSICYDGGFPESARCMTLQGADLILLPTNWPNGAEVTAEHAINTRALENTVYFAAVNRIGVERGTPFIGMSRICDPLGRTISAAQGTEEVTLYADIDVQRSRNKHCIRKAGINEVNRIADRRPEMYGTIVEPHNLKRPGNNV
ncbi:MAG: carbon-nitrogen hydrolase family protein [Planctomycetes bacterium]|nr:carbon-nitrogen hydrolase family protein [Planctomycetota bacterium]